MALTNENYQTIKDLLMGFRKVYNEEITYAVKGNEDICRILTFLRRLRYETKIKKEPIQMEFSGAWHISAKNLPTGSIEEAIYLLWHKIYKARSKTSSEFEWINLGLIEGFLYRLLLDISIEE